MDSFAFIIHPIDVKRDVARKFPLGARLFSERQINFLSTFFPPLYISEIEGVTSAATGKQITGWFVACPYTPARMLSLPEKTVYRKIIQTGRLAEKLGAQMLGLGAFTSVVGDAGQTIAQALDIPVTTGDAYTVAIAIQAVQEAARRMGVEPASATAAVVGAGGAVGRVCAELLASEVAELHLIGRSLESLQPALERTAGQACRVIPSLSLEPLKQAQIIITVTSALHTLIEPQHLRPGSVVCDVARPRDVAARVASTRNDVLVIDGGMVEVPGPVDFHFNFGFPPGKAYACMAETMALALEGRFEDYTVGRDFSAEHVRQTAALCARHGFKLSGFRSFEHAVTDQQIEQVRRHAQI